MQKHRSSTGRTANPEEYLLNCAHEDEMHNSQLYTEVKHDSIRGWASGARLTSASRTQTLLPSPQRSLNKVDRCPHRNHLSDGHPDLPQNSISERVASLAENKSSLKEKLDNYVRMGNGVSPPQHVPLNLERDENSFWEYNSITIQMGNADSAKGSKTKGAEIKRKFNLKKLVPIVKSMATEPRRLEGKKALSFLSGKTTLKNTRNVELSNYPLDVSYYADEAEEKMRSKLGLYLRARSTSRRL